MGKLKNMSIKAKIIIIVCAVLVVLGSSVFIGVKTLNNKVEEPKVSEKKMDNQDTLDNEDLEDDSNEEEPENEQSGEDSKEDENTISNDEKASKTASNSNSSSNKNTTTTNNSSSNQNKSNETTPSAPTTTTKSVAITKEVEEVTNKEEAKYGVTLNIVTIYKITTYSDGSEDKEAVRTKKVYDYSTYNGTTNSLKAEATSLMNQNMGIYNEVVSLTNNLRSEANPSMSQLTLDNNLTLAATIRALEMAYADKFDHTRPNGSSCFSIFNDLGISVGGAGENIAAGYGSPSSVVNGWRNSSGHYANMINTGFNKIGVGSVTYNGTKYWVQLFTS